MKNPVNPVNPVHRDCLLFSLTNRYTAIDAAPIAHDTAGNLTRDRQNYRYEYDYENRIARIYKLSGETQITVASFDYDALGHRVRKIDAITGTTSLYYNDPEWRVLAEYNGTGTLQRTFVWGNYIDEALRMRAGGSDYYFLHDHLYSPAVLLNSSGTVVERYEYDAYGTTHIMDPSFGARAATQYGVTTLFTGRTLDALDSGALKIMYYRHRYTDPFTGRFLQQDPLEYRDGMNLFEYVKSNPTRYVDPDGQIRWSEIKYCSGFPVTAINPIFKSARLCCCAQAQIISGRPIEQAGIPGKAKQRYGALQDGTVINAIYHCVWQCMIANSICGPRRAKHIGDNHESGANNPDDKRMDLHNNQVGRDVAAAGASNWAECFQGCEAKAMSLELWWYRSIDFNKPWNDHAISIISGSGDYLPRNPEDGWSNQ